MEHRILSRLFVISTLGLAVASCGGGSSASSNSSSSSTPEPAAKVISANVVNIDQCRNETVNRDVALLIHNDDFSTKTIVRPNAQGELNYQSDEASETVSLLHKNVDSLGVETVRIRTYVDHPIESMGTFFSSIDNQQSCNCRAGGLNIIAPARDNGFIFGQSRNGLTRLDSQLRFLDGANFDLEVCQENGQWPTMAVELLFDQPSETYAAIVPAFDLNPAVNVVEADLVQQFANVNVFSPTGQFLDVQRSIVAYNDRERILSHVGFGLESVRYFDSEHIDHYRVGASHLEVLTIPELRNPFVFHTANRFVSEVNADNDVTLNQVDVSRLATILDLESGYNLADLSGYDFTRLAVIGRSGANDVFSWRITAPMSGTMPDLDNLDISGFDDADIDSVIEVQFIASVGNYANINGYQDYLLRRTSFDFTNPVESVANGFSWSQFSSIVSTTGLGAKSVFDTASVNQQGKRTNKAIRIKTEFDSETLSVLIK